MAGSIFIPLKTVLDNSGIKKAQSEFGKLGKSLKGALGAAGVGIGLSSLSSQLTSAVKAAEGVRKSNARLEQVAKSMNLFGAATGETTKRLQAYADTLEGSTGVEAETIKLVQAKLLTFKNIGITATEVGGQFDIATQAALDLAATGFGTAESNAVQLGKALQDPIKGITALARAGVTFTDEEKQKIRTLVESNRILEAQKLILGALQTQVGGVAEATASTSDKIKNAFGAVEDAVGFALLPALEDFSDFLNSPDGKDSLDNFAASAANLTTVLVNLGKVLSGAGLQNSLASFAILTGVAAGNVDKNLVAETTRKLLNDIGKVDLGNTTFFFGQGRAEAGLGTKVFDDLTKSALSGGSIRAIEEAASRAAKATAAIAGGGGGGGRGGAKGLSEAQKKAAEAIKAATKAADDQAKAYIKAAEAAEEFMVSTGKMLNSFTELFKVTPELGKFEQTAVDAFSNIFDTIDSALADGMILSGAASQLREYADSERKTLQAIAKQRDVLAGKIDVARSITSGVLGLVNITNLLETTSRSVTETVTSISNGISVAVTKTFDVVSSGGLVDNFQKLVDKTKAFAKNLVELKKLGLNKQLFAQLVQAGADAGGATAEALVAGGSETISALNILYNELADSAGDIAATATDTLYEVGQQMVSNGFIEGLLAQDSALVAAAKTLADSFAETFRKELQRAIDALLPNNNTLIDQVGAVDLGGSGVGGRGVAFNSASAGRATIFNVNVSAGVVTDPNGLAKTVIDSVKKYERSNGSVWVAAS
jgi:hypothetical protein